MRPTSRFARACRALVAIVQIALPPGSAIFDARLEAAALAAGPQQQHVESGTQPTCPQVHGPDCALCRVLSASARVAPPVRLAVAPQPRQSALGALGDSAAATAQVTLPLSRAPPSLA